MAILQLPVRSDLPSYEFMLELDGAVWGFRFHYNTRLSLWSFDITDTAGNDIIAGIPVLANTDLMAPYTTAGRPPGRFLAYDESGEAKNPSRYDLGQDVVLLYQEAST